MLRAHGNKFTDIGLLIVRVGIGASFLAHGIPKLIEGPERWLRLSENVGITLLPMLFGFVAGVFETVGGTLLILGFMTRTALTMLLIVMAAAFWRHLSAGDPYSDVSHPMELGIIFVALLFIGPGTYSLDHYRNRTRIIGL